MNSRSVFKRLVLNNPPGQFRRWLHCGAPKPSKEAIDAVSRDVMSRIRAGLHDQVMALVARSWFATAKAAVPEATDEQCIAFAVHKSNVMWEDMLRSMGQKPCRKVDHPTVNVPEWAEPAGRSQS